ncbi:helix-turn-helix domain-containing protein [Neobacillus sp. NRS-1170]|uniref:helix-turn-helix domain-containing protein n=1 Tax=Neobacillus sp. NRS-1170 TaxID=3233898 RepID=UPI003D29581A
MSDFLKLVGNKIRFVRKEKGLTQEELAEKCDLQYTYIGGIERGERNISLQTVEKLADGLQVSPYELIKFDEIPPQDIISQKSSLIEVFKSILLNRSEDEIRMLQKITKDILDLLDSQKNSK